MPDGASSNPPGPPVHPLDEHYYVRGDKEAYGPYDGRTLKDMIEQGKLLPTTGIARVGATEWTEIRNDAFFGAVRQAAGYAPADPTIVRLPGAPGAEAVDARQPLHYAGFWIRLVAYVVDAIILTIIGSVVGAVIGGGVVTSTGGGDAAAGLAGGIGSFAGFIIAILYYVLFLRSGWQATPGKRLLGLYVITTSGERVSGWRALGRYFAYILSALPLCIGFMMIGWNKEKKGLHDMVCDTRVVYGRL